MLSITYNWWKSQENGQYKQIQMEHSFFFQNVSWKNISFHRTASLRKHSYELKQIYVCFYNLTTIQLHSLSLKKKNYSSFTEDPTASHRQTLQILLQLNIQSRNLNLCLDFSLASSLSLREHQELCNSFIASFRQNFAKTGKLQSLSSFIWSKKNESIKKVSFSGVKI